MHPNVENDIDRGHHGANVKRVRMRISAAGETLSRAAMLGHKPVNL